MAKTLIADIKERAKDTFDNPSHTRIFINEFGVDATPDTVAQDVLQRIYKAIKDEVLIDPTNQKYGTDPVKIAKKLNDAWDKEEVTQEFESARMAEITQQVLRENIITGDSFTVDGNGKVSGVQQVDLQTRITQALDEEIKKDPLKIGYKKMTKEEAFNAMKKAQRITKKVKVAQTPRISEILTGIPFAPNEIDSDTVQKALES